MSCYHYFATVAKGLEETLAEELNQLGVTEIEAAQGGVAFQGSRVDGYRACLWLRTASRVLQPLADFASPTDEALYQGLLSIAWEEHLSPEMTIAVDANLRDSNLTHSHYAALKAKDAIVDRLRDHFGRRPSIDPKAPDLRVNIHLVRNRCTVSLDLAGTGLHRRGYRQDTTLAPLRETLAAARLLEDDFDVPADVWSVTSFNVLRRDGQETERWNRLHPDEDPRTSYVESCFADSEGPFVAATDYMAAVPDQIRQWIPGRYITLGTDGFGRSDGREALRKHFEVDRHQIVVAALDALAADGKIDRVSVARAIEQYELDPDKLDPVRD